MWHKRCTGPAHDEPVWLPATEKYFYARNSERRKGELLSRCRLCVNWSSIQSRGESAVMGFISTHDALPFFREAVGRVGLQELSRRTGLNANTIWKVLNLHTQRVQKTTLRKVMLELISMRRKNEHSINESARVRNERRLISAESACAECGGSLENYTEGCRRCLWRKDGRERRRQAA